MATPVLSRLRRVLVWAKAGNASPIVTSSNDNLFIPLLVGGERPTLQPLHASKSHGAEAGRASHPPVACNGASRPVAVIHTARARSLFATLRGLLKANSPCATSPLRTREAFANVRTTKSCLKRWPRFSPAFTLELKPPATKAA